MSYKCPNDDGFGEWICLCPTKENTAKETILKMYNGWIVTLIDRAKAKCSDPNFTETDALKEIAFLEEEASGMLAMWKTSL